MTIKTIVRACLFTAALLTTAGAVRAEPLTKVRLAQNLAPISGLTIIAKAEGFFAKHGLDVAVSNFTSGKQCLDTVIGGGADVATVAEAPVTASVMAGQKVAFVAGMEYSDDKTLTSQAAGIRSRADLKGKRIAFTAGTGSEVYTAELLRSARLTPKDVTLVNLRPQEMLPALATGSIDAFDTWEPYVAFGRKALGAKVAELDTKGVYTETFNIVVTQAYLRSDQSTVERFLAALVDAESWTKQNRDEAVRIVAKTVGMKSDDLGAIWNDYVFRVAISDKQIEALERHARWRLATGNHPPGVSSVPDFGRVVEPRALLSIDPSRVTYRKG